MKKKMHTVTDEEIKNLDFDRALKAMDEETQPKPRPKLALLGAYPSRERLKRLWEAWKQGGNALKDALKGE